MLNRCWDLLDLSKLVGWYLLGEIVLLPASIATASLPGAQMERRLLEAAMVGSATSMKEMAAGSKPAAWNNSSREHLPPHLLHPWP